MQLAQNAVHGAMAGYTAFSSGVINNRTVSDSNPNRMKQELLYPFKRQGSLNPSRDGVLSIHQFFPRIFCPKVYIPIQELVDNSPRNLNIYGRTWERVLTITRQPSTVEPRQPAPNPRNDVISKAISALSVV